MKRKSFDTILQAVILAIFVQLWPLRSLADSVVSTYPYAILPGDYADPSILRDGDDYYMTHSPFQYRPGFLIWHSKDLVNWEPFCRALPEFDGSAMAPDLVKYKQKYYIYIPSANGHIFVTVADKMAGPWSKPVLLDVTGIDPGHIVDRDGKRYLFVNEGEVVPLSDDGLKVTGKKQKVYNGWRIPRNYVTEGQYLESPKLTYHNGYYYLTSAEGGTAGPPTSHMVITARSKNIMGPWENSPYNPIVHTWSASETWWSKGHGTLVDDTKGNWWVVYHAYANGLHSLGRQTLIEPIEWTSDGWYRPATQQRQLPARYVNTVSDISDDFTAPNLKLLWSFWKNYEPQSVKTGNGSLMMTVGKPAQTDSLLLLTTATDRNYTVSVDVTVGKGTQGGLLLFYSEKGYSGVMTDGKTFTIYYNKEKKTTVPNRIGRHFVARIHNRAGNLVIEVSKDGKAWQTLADNVDGESLNHTKLGGFFALRPALPAIGKGTVTYRHFVYQNGVPTEKDMAAYLMVFHKDEDHGLHMALSRDGYHFTALNGQKPVIAGDTIAEQRGIRDPHIYRGPDGAFYLAMTDLHVFAQREGKRATEWERDGKIYAWGNNKNLVLMKSWDLIHWSRSLLRVDKYSPEFSEIGCAWAPETIYDPKAGKLMIYFTMRFKNGPNRIYYAYVNNDFNKLESAPRLLFEYPDGKTTAIDGDICPYNGKYILSYVAHEMTPGIKQAVSDHPTGPWQFSPKWIDFEPKACEAPTIFKRIGEDKWVLIYDNYGNKVTNFGFEETTDFVNWKPLGHFNDSIMFSTNFDKPKHCGVTTLTDAEARKLAAYWHLDYDALPAKEFDHQADKPLYRDPIYDGAADPTIIYNKARKTWWMFYTNRRANMTGGKGVEWVHSTPIGIAESKDGATWRYVGDANINYGKDKGYTYWAPDVVEANGKYHMFLTVVPGIFADWKHPREIVHLTSTNLKDWKFEDRLELASDRVIDADLIQAPDGRWLMFYNNEADRKSVCMAESRDLKHWTDHGKIIGDKRGEGPNVFRWHNKYFMIVDNWDGQGIYSSDDLKTWTRQKDEILSAPGKGADDGVNGNHAEVVVNGDRAYIFYFTHPGRAGGNKADNYATRRSTIQVAELQEKDGIISCDRDKTVYINLNSRKQ